MDGRLTFVAAPMPASAVENVLSRLDKVKRLSTGGWVARCPAHQDKSPSLSVGEGDDGRVLLHCHAGCSADAITRALGLEERELFADQPQERRIVAVYPYHDETGTVLSETVRFEPKDFRQRRPDGTWGLGDTRRVLYHLPGVKQAIADGETIYVVEGEKDVHAIESAGLGTATTNPMGAGKWRAEYAEQLAGAKRVIIVADKDDPGVQHAQQVAESLHGHVGTVQIVQPAAGKDVSDHLAAGHTLEELVPRLVPHRPGLHVVTAQEFAAVHEESARPLLGDRSDTILAAGGIAVIYGKGGAGKTTLTLDLAMHLGAGRDWLSVTIGTAVRVLLIENEGPRGKFREKIEAKLSSWDGPNVADRLLVLEEPWSRFSFAEPAHRSQLATFIGDQHVDVVIAGPVQRLGVEGGGTPEEVSQFIDLVEQTRAELERPCAFAFVHHENKGGTVSGAWEGVPDTLAHVTAQGNGHTRLYWEKVRWASNLHGKTWHLLWGEGDRYTIDEKPEASDEDLAEKIVGAVRSSPGCSWKDILKVVKGRREDGFVPIRDRLLKDGIIVNLRQGEVLNHVVEKTPSHFYLSDDPEIQQLQPLWEKSPASGGHQLNRQSTDLPPRRSDGRSDDGNPHEQAEKLMPETQATEASADARQGESPSDGLTDPLTPNVSKGVRGGQLPSDAHPDRETPPPSSPPGAYDDPDF